MQRHLGLFWTRIRNRYPFTEDQLPVPAVIEPEGLLPNTAQAPAMSVLTGAVVPRCWFLSESMVQLIQVQPNRFWRNWRQVEGTEPYPRFGTLIEDFNAEWLAFLQFLRDEKLGSPNINQCELMYVNHIQLGEGLKAFRRHRRYSPCCPEKASGFLPPPEVVNWGARYSLPDGRGRLIVQMDPAYNRRLVSHLGLEFDSPRIAWRGIHGQRIDLVYSGPRMDRQRFR